MVTGRIGEQRGEEILKKERSENVSRVANGFPLEGFAELRSKGRG